MFAAGFILGVVTAALMALTLRRKSLVPAVAGVPAAGRQSRSVVGSWSRDGASRVFQVWFDFTVVSPGAQAESLDTSLQQLMVDSSRQALSAGGCERDACERLKALIEQPAKALGVAVSALTINSTSNMLSETVPPSALGPAVASSPSSKAAAFSSPAVTG